MPKRRIKAIFTQEFHYTSRERNAGWSAYPSPKVQKFPQEFIDAAVNAGCAHYPEGGQEDVSCDN